MPRVSRQAEQFYDVCGFLNLAIIPAKFIVPGRITHAEYSYKKNIFQMFIAECSREADKPTSADNDFYGCPAIFEFSCNKNLAFIAKRKILFYHKKFSLLRHKNHSLPGGIPVLIRSDNLNIIRTDLQNNVNI